MIEDYEREIGRIRAECTEAYALVQIEKEKKNQLEEDMRTLFLQHMTTINMQAMHLFHHSDGITGVKPTTATTATTSGDMEMKEELAESPQLSTRSMSGSLSPVPRSTPSSVMEDHPIIPPPTNSSHVPVFSAPSTPYMNPSDPTFTTGNSSSSAKAFSSPAFSSTQRLLQETHLQTNVSKGHYDKLQDMYKSTLNPSNKFAHTSSNAAPNFGRPSFVGSVKGATATPVPQANQQTPLAGSKRTTSMQGHIVTSTRPTSATRGRWH